MEEMTGEELKVEGMARAVNHADQKEPEWSSIAFSFLLQYIRSHDQFMGEDVRMASFGIVPEPPSARAWGSIISRAAKGGFITRIGYESVTNAKAHRSPASVWRVIKPGGNG